jgi:hypothetical protein
MAMPRKLARILVLTVAFATLGILANAPSVLAYGSNTQWQTAFSGTCSSQAAFCPFNPPGAPPGVHTGFWGWCAFGASAPDGLSGTAADCQITTYFGPASSIHIAYDVTHWTINTGSLFLPPGVPGFFITPGAGTLEITGPGPVPPFVTKGVPFPIPNPCPAFICDTGIPAMAGHVSFHPTPGVELNIQVTKLP